MIFAPSRPGFHCPFNQMLLAAGRRDVEALADRWDDQAVDQAVLWGNAQRAGYLEHMCTRLLSGELL